MRKPLQIGDKEFKFKKNALEYYKGILNSYDFGESLSDQHYDDIIDLLFYDTTFTDDHPEFDERNKEAEEENETNDEYVIKDIRIARAQFNTKCFELLYGNGETDIISYRLRITKPKEIFFSDFAQAARNIIQTDLRSVKQKYFDSFSKKGFVPCQETGILSKWTELVVDHRQPNTFSIIVDRFIEVNSIDVAIIEYETDAQNFYLFKDKDLIHRFRNYHKEKAVLRIVRKECNSSRAHQGRIRQQQKDLRIN